LNHWCRRDSGRRESPRISVRSPNGKGDALTVRKGVKGIRKSEKEDKRADAMEPSNPELEKKGRKEKKNIYGFILKKNRGGKRGTKKLCAISLRGAYRGVVGGRTQKIRRPEFGHRKEKKTVKKKVFKKIGILEITGKADNRHVFGRHKKWKKGKDFRLSDYATKKNRSKKVDWASLLIARRHKRKKQG